MVWLGTNDLGTNDAERTPVTPMTLFLLVLLVAVSTGAVVVWASSRRRGGPSDDLLATLRAELDLQRRELETQRDDTLHQAIRSVVAITSEQLGQQLEAGSQQLDHRNELVGERLQVMDEQLKEVRGLVSMLEQRRAASMGELAERLEVTGRATAELSRTTDALRQALSSSQTRGQWGERMAEDVLRTAGFVKGINYLKQASTAAGRPDFSFPLPAGRVVHMDVKFPLDNYLRHLEAATDDERARTLKDFRRDVRNRVKELSRRDYIDTVDGTLDQVLMFLPNEHLYAFIHQHDPELLDIALRAKVVLCSPLTLFAVLAVIRQAVDDHVMHVRSGEILEALGSFGKQWEMFTDELDKLGKRIDSARTAFESVNGPRRRQLERQLDKVDELRRGEAEAAIVALPGHRAAAG
jgi:DNA recombination protein RmuC